MDNSILTATVAPVHIGRIEIEGLKTECGQFAITVQQIASLFQVRPDNAQRNIKHALGKDCRFVKIRIKNARARKPENCLLLSEFSRFHRHLDRKGNAIAILIGDALGEFGFTQFFADAFDVNLSKSDRQNIVNRIMSKACPWEKLYEKDMCSKVQKWYGFDNAKFYWWYCYSWLSPEEKAKLEEVNPVEKMVAKSGKERIARKRKIHQHLEEQTRVRLNEFVRYLGFCIKFSDSRIEFEKKWNREYGKPEQLEIFDLWEFAD